ncbi:MAG: hypothetical protein BWZ03_00467 [bacterium ADurb.BinA186]|nr:MAG: hypothetical protein BWZ03_00467 [bacterium ADurb.BinA186]
MTIQLIAFDIGGVLARVDKSELLVLCQRAKLPIQEIFDNDFLDFQKGIVPQEQFIDNKSLKLSLPTRQFEHIFKSMMRPTQIGNFIYKIKTPWIFFSTINTLHYHHLLRQINVPYFARHNSILSFQEKQLKPHEQLFRKLSNVLPISPSQILVIDDKPINIHAALQYGYKAQIF